MKGVVGKNIPNSEKKARITFAAKSMINRLHKDGRIDRNTLPKSILDKVSNELMRRVSKVRKLTSR
jgi:hypothetical protein